MGLLAFGPESVRPRAGASVDEFCSEHVAVEDGRSLPIGDVDDAMVEFREHSAIVSTLPSAMRPRQGMREAGEVNRVPPGCSLSHRPLRRNALSARCGVEGGNPEMLVAASKRGPNVIARGHDARLEHIAPGTGGFSIAGFRQRRSPLLPVVRSEHVVAAGADGCSRDRAAVVGVCLEMSGGGSC